ncbi:rRNA maturation RNase YbeY [bacterium]|nr:rRNA maturation RNase YbeY [bacterium]MBU1650707.1 rRNA maturation RNase YbeY [bacterium]MBU1882373.1 rRNA maturation RNase YbeY [bacterium]
MPDSIVTIHCDHPYGEPDLDGLNSLAEHVIRTENWRFNATIILVDDAGIIRLNRSFLQKDDVTDVIAFQVDEENDGEVYINLDEARKQALEADEPIAKAVQRLLVHGILHLGGWIDGTDDERKKMLAHGETYL